MTFCFSCIWVPAIWAQHQEPGLVDRLLRPNMDLQNNAQGKKFAGHPALVEGRGTVGTFFLQPKRAEKSFADTRTLDATEYRSRSFADSSRSSASIKNSSASTAAAVETFSVRGIRGAPDANRTVAGRDFAGQHPFQGEGKSQKSLDRQNPPLTIEQVRELLNKNK